MSELSKERRWCIDSTGTLIRLFCQGEMVADFPRGTHEQGTVIALELLLADANQFWMLAKKNDAITAERDRLAAELERVTAERDALVGYIKFTVDGDWRDANVIALAMQGFGPPQPAAAEPESAPAVCETCGGKGHSETVAYDLQSGEKLFPCPTCNGTGRARG